MYIFPFLWTQSMHDEDAPPSRDHGISARGFCSGLMPPARTPRPSGRRGRCGCRAGDSTDERQGRACHADIADACLMRRKVGWDGQLGEECYGWHCTGREQRPCVLCCAGGMSQSQGGLFRADDGGVVGGPLHGTGTQARPVPCQKQPAGHAGRERRQTSTSLLFGPSTGARAYVAAHSSSPSSAD